MGNFLYPPQHQNNIQEAIQATNQLKTCIENLPENMKAQTKLNELKKENQTLKHLLEQEKREKESLREIINKHNIKENNIIKVDESDPHKIIINKHNISNLSQEKIEKFVDNMLKNPDINIKHFPDVIERKIYINIFRLILSMLDEFLDNTKIEIMGHKIEFDLTK